MPAAGVPPVFIRDGAMPVTGDDSLMTATSLVLRILKAG
jgi:hypothetical protein